MSSSQPTTHAITHAMVLAAGLGTRMRPLTDTTPKPLINVAGKPLLDWALARIAEAGVTDVVVNTHYLGEQIETHLKSRRHPRVYISREDPVLETGGGIQAALDHLGGTKGDRPFFVCNSDGLWLDGKTSALSRLADMWDDSAMDGILLLHDRAHAFGYHGKGDFVIRADGQLTRRTDSNAAHPAYVFTGVQLLHPRLFEKAPGGAYSLNILYNLALSQGRLYGLIHDGAWFHVGTPDARAETERHILSTLGHRPS